MSESKPSDDASLRIQGAVKTGVVSVLQESVGTTPDYGLDGSRCKGGMNSTQASVWNVRTLLRMSRERQIAGTMRMSTDAEARGGAARSSVEALVMRVERRGSVIRLTCVVNPLCRG
jgi:hypothetical protein